MVLVESSAIRTTAAASSLHRRSDMTPWHTMPWWYGVVCCTAHAAGLCMALQTNSSTCGCACHAVLHILAVGDVLASHQAV
jgi:hypothetical protein